jgi:pyrroloquinoline quinone biosynthesis protein B
MEIVLLGTAAGGGVPQWNCWCATCRVARAEPARVHPRTQSSIAVSPDGHRWFLINASPDVREQLSRLPGRRPAPPEVVRQVPIEAVVLTDAELDHSLGIVLLREARALSVYATDAVTRVLEQDSHVLPTTRAFATVTVHALPLDAAVPLRDRAGVETGLTVEAFAVPGDPPRFARHDEAGHTVGLLVRHAVTGGTLAYVPGCGALDDALMRRLRAADAVLFDGTFWSDDELTAIGISSLSARAMGHLPIGGADGSLQRLSTLPARSRVYTHINNSNPILVEDSAARAAVHAAGLVVGDDGLTLSV